MSRTSVDAIAAGFTEEQTFKFNKVLLTVTDGVFRDAKHQRYDIYGRKARF